jgi:hypothetical protein
MKHVKFSLLHSMGKEQGPRAEVYECSNESSGYIKTGNFLTK